MQDNRDFLPEIPSALAPFALIALTLQQALYGTVLGVVQGISEWLPVSSKTQVIVISTYLLRLPFSTAYTFGLFMEIGTILAAVIYFRRELLALLRFLARRGDADSQRLFGYVLVSMVATGIIGAPLYIMVASIQGAYNIGIPMLLLGFVLICDALLIRHARSKHARAAGKRRKLADMGLKDYVLVGIAQGIAALPGVSRSGITTSTMLLLNVEADEAFRLSFLNCIFATSAAVALTLIVSAGNVAAAVGTIGASGLVIAIVVSTAVSLLLIDFILRIARHSKIVYLTAALGALALFGGAIGAITNVGG
jgi:undecaprenyl-diphosphatase